LNSVFFVAQQPQQINFLAADTPSLAVAEIAELGCLVGGVPRRRPNGLTPASDRTPPIGGVLVSAMLMAASVVAYETSDGKQR